MARRPLLHDVGAQGRDAWICTALDVLSAEGIQGVRVEQLARKLKITKGSFYHHFKDRNDLLSAMLEYWRRRLVVDVIEQLQQIGDPRERLQRLIRLPNDVARADRDIDLAVMLWARKDRRAATALAQADRSRIDFICGVLVACGVPKRDAAVRAVLALAFLRGAPALDEAAFRACERLLTQA